MLYPFPNAQSPNPPTRILIVDDNRHHGEISKSALSLVNGYEVQAERNPLNARQIARDWKPDLIILDVFMPELDGITLGKLLKEDGCDADLMFVTGGKGMDTLVEGLRVGDEYLTKPYDPIELRARVGVLLRRRRPTSQRAQTTRAATSLLPVMTPGSATVRIPRGRDAKLTPTERRLLMALLETPGQPVPAETLLKKVWNSDLGDSSILHVTISRLRKQIEYNRKRPKLIITTSTGYYYNIQP